MILNVEIEHAGWRFDCRRSGKARLMNTEKICKAPPVPQVLREMMGNALPLYRQNSKLYEKFLLQLAAELQPRGVVEWKRVIELAMCEWHSVWLKRCRKLMIERQCTLLLQKEAIEVNVPRGRKPRPDEVKAAKEISDQMMSELWGARLDLHSAKAVCAAADDLAKLEVLIESSERMSAMMRAECEPLAARARAEAGLWNDHLEKALVKSDAAASLTHIRAVGEEGGQSLADQADLHGDVMPAVTAETATPTIRADGDALPEGERQTVDEDSVSATNYRQDGMHLTAATDTESA
jgi:hypothetical protein